MPEGDTIFRTARAMHRALAGDEVSRFESVFPKLNRVHEDAPLIGRSVEQVSAAGKHVLVHLSGDLVLRSHMRMKGSWHLYRPGERWQKPASALRVRLDTARFVAVAFDVHDVELAPRERLQGTRHLGPDLMGIDFDLDEAVRRVLAAGRREIGLAILDQGRVAGIGNEYRSELLFRARLSPMLPSAEVPEAAVRALLADARELLFMNVAEGTYRGGRRTRRRSAPGERTFVYGRAGKPCRVCGTPIVQRRRGENARLTYWCPRCQPLPDR